MATLRELLGESYKEGMTLAEAEKALEGKNLVDLSTGEYVSKASLLIKTTSNCKKNKSKLLEITNKAKYNGIK